MGRDLSEWIAHPTGEQPEVEGVVGSRGDVCRPCSHWVGHISPRVGNLKNNDPGLVEPINLP
jgi:hypothetical protein